MREKSKKLFALILAMFMILGIPGVYAISGTVDQANESRGDWAYSIYGNKPIGQEFIPQMPLLTGVEVYVMGLWGPAADITVNIREATINGTVIASKTIYAVASDIYNWLYFGFDCAIPVNTGSVYVIEVQSTNDTHYLYTNENVYAPGNMLYVVYIEKITDLCFRTYGMELPPVPVNNITPMAAPNIAEIILAAEGVSPNQSIGKGKDREQLNLISETARHMGPQTQFDGIEKSVIVDGVEVCNPAYWDAVLAFLNSLGPGFTFDYTLYDYIEDQP